ncbi:hypothetical protein D7Z54_30670 [Salibacterium salarium]|uniref:Regulatory protein YycH domain-containing protein n=1 Tax=Salibacterium salarium TaxID=284579 RepID=A0A3R9WMG6_9BACI|nr:two-component system activity regulator YycH [Salibacterium salarium]RSL29525.1 hypothetical protein D7Z54_30670 [Salibacterium salarium]
MKERIKSWVLTVLVALSVFLTWQLWTYEPEYDSLSEESTYAPNEELGEERSLQDVVEPDQLVIHNGERHAALNATDDLFSSFYDDLLESRIDNLTLDQNFEDDELYDSPRAVEVIYPTPIPSEVMEQILNFEEDTPNLSLDTIDRILVQDGGGDTESLQVQFVSHEESFVLEGETNFSLSEFREQYILQMNDYTSVFGYELENDASVTETIYLPEDPVTYNTLSDTSTEIDYNNFVGLLFSESDYVEQYRQDNQEASFTDGNRMMSVEENGSYLTYVNPVYSENNTDSQNHVINTTFQFVNSRGGWNDHYRLYDWKEQSQEDTSTYRMVVAGLPIFTSSGADLTSINVSRSAGQVSEYSRPLFTLDDTPIDSRGSMELVSGQEVINYAEDQFEPSQLEDFQVGYQMEKQDSLVVRFEPNWYVKYDGAWYPVNPKEAEETEEG